MSKRARKAYLKRFHAELFPDGMVRGTVQQPSERERDLAQAARLRDLAQRGMCRRKYLREAEQLEAKWKT